MKKIKKIHFTGIKGVGLTPLAIIAKQAGLEVSGSDVPDEFITDEELNEVGIDISKGFDIGNVDDKDIVVATAAHDGLDNIEAKAAKERGIRLLTHAEALGEFQKGEVLGKKFHGISVTGSHGKTTTTAIIATLFSSLKIDPSYAIGTGKIPSLGLSGHLGKGEFFIAEADEYYTDLKYKRVPKLYFQFPKFLVITNIDFDHPDIYSSLEEIEEVFFKFTDNITNDGMLVICGDDNSSKKLLEKYKRKKVTYGFDSSNDFVISNVKIKEGITYFNVNSNYGSEEYKLNVIGKQNTLNAASAIILAKKLGYSFDEIRDGLALFRGSKRRQEFKGKIKNVLFYDDYAHHPEEILQTLDSFRQNFPKHRIITVFQPHTFTRTIKLLDDFTKAFFSSDEIIIMEVFASFREKNDFHFSSKKLSDKITNLKKPSEYFPDITDVVKYLSSIDYNIPTVIITMGAGDVYKVGDLILENGSR